VNFHSRGPIGRTLLLFAVVVFAAGRAAAGDADPRAAALAELAQTYADEHLLNGAVLAADANGIVQQGAYGMACREWNVPNTVDTRFRIGSIAKVFTAAVVMQLHEEGRIDLNAPVTTYLTSLHHPDAGRITIHHLLTHSSGLPHDFFPLSVENICREYTVRDLIARANDLPPVAYEPGSDQTYSNVNYVLLAAVIQAVSGETWADAVQRRILDVVGMHDTVFDRFGAVIPHRAYGYYHASGIFVKSPEPNMSFDRGGGGIYSTVGDLYLFARALLDGKLLTKESLDATFTQHVKVQGYAWRLWSDVEGYPEAAGRIAHHRGRIDGFTSQLTVDLDRGWVFVVLDNIMNGERWEFTARQATILAGEEAAPVPVSHAARILEILRRDGVEAAEESAHRITEEHPELVAGEPQDGNSGTPLEESLNHAGFTLLEGRRYDEAIEVMRLNQRLFQDRSANAQIALGYAYATAGRFDEAEPWVAVTRAMDPENPDATEVEGMIAEGRKGL
jgi:CubicO group peptidase (beta-lactamase class C family)